MERETEGGNRGRGGGRTGGEWRGRQREEIEGERGRTGSRVERERVEDGRDTGKETPIKPHPLAHS